MHFIFLSTFPLLTFFLPFSLSNWLLSLHCTVDALGPTSQLSNFFLLQRRSCSGTKKKKKGKQTFSAPTKKFRIRPIFFRNQKWSSSTHRRRSSCRCWRPSSWTTSGTRLWWTPASRWPSTREPRSWSRCPGPRSGLSLPEIPAAPTHVPTAARSCWTTPSTCLTAVSLSTIATSGERPTSSTTSTPFSTTTSSRLSAICRTEELQRVLDSVGNSLAGPGPGAEPMTSWNFCFFYSLLLAL